MTRAESAPPLATLSFPADNDVENAPAMVDSAAASRSWAGKKHLTRTGA